MKARAARVLGALGIIVLLAGCGGAATRAGIASPVPAESATSYSSSTVIEANTSSAVDTTSQALVTSDAEDAALLETVSAPASEKPESAAFPSVPPEVARAIAAAEGYLAFAPFSKKGLIDQLSSAYGDGYPPDIAEAAVTSLDVDWKEQAAKAAANYLDMMAFSKQGLIEQLESDAGDGYTHDEAVYGAEKAYGSAAGDSSGAQGSGSSAELTNAIKAAQNYLSFMAFSQKGLIEQLSSGAGDSYSKETATAAVTNLDVDWNEQAVKAAENYLDLMPFSKQELIGQLVDGDGFTRDQAVYGVSKAYQ